MGRLEFVPGLGKEILKLVIGRALFRTQDFMVNSLLETVHVFLFCKSFFYPLLKFSCLFHNASIKNFLRLSQQKFSDPIFCACTLMESEKGPCTLEMMINRSK